MKNKIKNTVLGLGGIVLGAGLAVSVQSDGKTFEIIDDGVKDVKEQLVTVTANTEVKEWDGTVSTLEKLIKVLESNKARIQAEIDRYTALKTEIEAELSKLPAR